jgi:hypothetical protein
LQDEEAYTAELAALEVIGNKSHSKDIPDTSLTLKKDFMYYFYSKNVDGKQQYRDRTPITLINTTRSNDGRRGIISSIRLDDNYFNEALDLIGYLYEDSIWSVNSGLSLCHGKKKRISLVTAFNTSELFPFLSAPAYINTLGSFVDGGYHENSGLKTTLDIYDQLKERLHNDSDLKTKKYRVYIVYLKNGDSEKQLYKPMASQLPVFQPLMALFNQPFEGSASYFEEKARNIGVNDPLARSCPLH